MSKKESKWLNMMKFLEKNNNQYNDRQFSERFALACKEIPENKSVTYKPINDIIYNRVEKYCKENNIEISEYGGCLPFRVYKNNE